MKNAFLSRLMCGVMVLLIITLTACTGMAPETATFSAMDTVMSLTVYGGSCCGSIEERAAELDSKLSAVDENSEIFALNRDSRAVLSEDTAALVSRSLEICGEVGGSFDITVFPAVTAWGFTTGEYKVPDEAELAALADKIDWRGVNISGNKVELSESVMIDLGAVAKGYLADESKRILADCGASGAVLNLGGTILLYGEKPDGTEYKVGIADPRNPASYFGYLSPGDGVIATSGGYERYFERGGKRYIHILDPATAAPVQNGVLSVTVFCEEGTLADALSTALFVMGTASAAEYYREKGGFEFIILDDSGTVYVTEGIADKFTLIDVEMKTVMVG